MLNGVSSNNPSPKSARNKCSVFQEAGHRNAPPAQHNQEA